MLLTLISNEWNYNFLRMRKRIGVLLLWQRPSTSTPSLIVFFFNKCVHVSAGAISVMIRVARSTKTHRPQHVNMSPAARRKGVVVKWPGRASWTTSLITRRRGRRTFLGIFERGRAFVSPRRRSLGSASAGNPDPRVEFLPCYSMGVVNCETNA